MQIGRQDWLPGGQAQLPAARRPEALVRHGSHAPWAEELKSMGLEVVRSVAVRVQLWAVAGTIHRACASCAGVWHSRSDGQLLSIRRG
eukprot:CAMPEP_0115876622 /NCGR_PEP_ID=MMETSP0287-20121206/25773_1 /TAXON_ID=412157 /ORGANISM="Chrysochromulina rotalis, Strain UIO044" /LENGTH=87 /DNA_ID=CAMNT_0003332053 /DNA_START=495 /DNA_END=758 /DNA_ORIENTATION=+